MTVLRQELDRNFLQLGGPVSVRDDEHAQDGLDVDIFAQHLLARLLQLQQTVLVRGGEEVRLHAGGGVEVAGVDVVQHLIHEMIRYQLEVCIIFFSVSQISGQFI